MPDIGRSEKKIGFSSPIGNQFINIYEIYLENVFL